MNSKWSFIQQESVSSVAPYTTPTCVGIRKHVFRQEYGEVLKLEEMYFPNEFFAVLHTSLSWDLFFADVNLSLKIEARYL
jgi:hypothetical protein